MPKLFENGCVCVLKQLIEARCNVDLQTNNGTTPLFNAAKSGHAAVTEQLIEAHCDIDLQEQDGYTPLYGTVNKDHVSVTAQLIEARCNLDLQQKDGVTQKEKSGGQGTASACDTVSRVCGGM
jgi:ankyrin repeat protein